MTEYIWVFIFPLFAVSAVLAVFGSICPNKMTIHYIAKPTTTFLIIIMVLLGYITKINNIFYLILIALSFSLIGDIFIMFMNIKKYFILGLVSFLIAHIFYALAFLVLKPFSPSDLYCLIPIAIADITLLYLFRRNLKNEIIPILIYLIAISFMLWRSYSIFTYAMTRRNAFIAAGATLFFTSDVFIAYERFRNKIPCGDLFILSFYFIAQFLIALSINGAV